MLSYEKFKPKTIQSSVFTIDPTFNTARVLTFLVAHDEKLSRILFSSDFTAEFPAGITEISDRERG